MALQGTLEDLSIVSLLQFPHTGRKTGLLKVEGESGEARIYYQQGALIHISLGNLRGRDALVEVVGWTRGSFSFQAGVEAPDTNLEGDLHRELMKALKEVDEKKKAELEAQAKAREDARTKARANTSAKLREAFDQARTCMFAAVLDKGGRILASIEGERSDWSSIVTYALGAVSGYPRRPLGRLLTEDSEGTISIAEYDEGNILVMVCAPGTNLGLLFRVLGKFLEEN
jgi:hypothetical protein